MCVCRCSSGGDAPRTTWAEKCALWCRTTLCPSTRRPSSTPTTCSLATTCEPPSTPCCRSCPKTCSSSSTVWRTFTFCLLCCSTGSRPSTRSVRKSPWSPSPLCWGWPPSRTPLKTGGDTIRIRGSTTPRAGSTTGRIYHSHLVSWMFGEWAFFSMHIWAVFSSVIYQKL